MLTIKAEQREITGKKVSNLRKQGKIPAVVYGAGEKSVLLQVIGKDFEKVFREAGESTLVELEIGQDRRNVLIHEIDFDPIKDTPRHVDFLAVRMDKPIRAKVHVVFEGESGAVKNLGGVLVKVTHELEIEALPKDLPHEIRVDIAVLGNLGEKLVAGGLKLPAGVKLVGGKEDVLVLVEAPKSEEELKAEEAAPSLETIEVVSKKKEKEEEAVEAIPKAEKAETPKEAKKEGK